MCYRIDRLDAGGDCVVFRLSGRIQGQDLETLRESLKQEKGEFVIDLKEVALVDREVVMFLAGGETSGIELRNCPPFVREWVDREKRSN